MKPLYPGESRENTPTPGIAAPIVDSPTWWTIATAVFAGVLAAIAVYELYNWIVYALYAPELAPRPIPEMRLPRIR